MLANAWLLKSSEKAINQTYKSISGQPIKKSEVLKLQLWNLRHREPYPSSIYFYIYRGQAVVLQAWL